jgi:hypothetical protein
LLQALQLLMGGPSAGDQTHCPVLVLTYDIKYDHESQNGLDTKMGRLTDRQLQGDLGMDEASKG